MALATDLNVLDINQNISYEHGITQVDGIHHYPYNLTNVGYNDEIRITINQKNVYTLPCNAQLHITAKLKDYDSTKFSLDAYGIQQAFTEASYYINGEPIEIVTNVGLTNLVRSTLLITQENTQILYDTGFTGDNPYKNFMKIDTAKKTAELRAIIDLKYFFSFCADYQKPLIYSIQEIVFKRNSHDKNIFQTKVQTLASTDSYPTLEIEKISIRMPYIKVEPEFQNKYLQYVKNNTPITIQTHEWKLYENVNVPQTTDLRWNIKTINENDRISHVIVFFQTNKRNDYTKTMFAFDHCNVRDLKVYIGQQYFPRDTYNTDFENNDFALHYNDFKYFEYQYNKFKKLMPESITTVSMEIYKSTLPLFVIPVMNREVEIKNGVADLLVQVQTRSPIPANTIMYAIVVSQRVFVQTLQDDKIESIM